MLEGHGRRDGDTVKEPPSRRSITLALGLMLGGLGVAEGQVGIDTPRQGGALRSLPNPPIPKSLPHLRQAEPPDSGIMASVLLPDFCPSGGAGELSAREGEPCGGLDHVAAGTGLRNRDAGVIELTGAPPGASLVEAFLYWGVISSEEESLSHKEVLFDGVAVDGELVGSSQEPCWLDGIGFYAFRASVADRLRPGINGSYTVRLDLDPAITDGRDPWHDALVTLTPPLAEGASLVVVFSHPALPPTSVVYLHEGPLYFAEALTVHHPLAAPLPEASGLRHSRLGADGQTHADGEPTLPIQTSLGKIVVDESDLTLIRGSGSEIDLHHDWQGADASSATRLWDTQSTVLRRDATNLKAGDLGYEVHYAPLMPEPAEGPELAQELTVSRAYPTDPPAPDPDEVLLDCVVVVAHALTAW